MRGAIEAVYRIEFPRLVAGLARLTGDLDFAEDLAADALVAALERWPLEGIPSKPGAWLATVAKRRAIDVFRRGDRFDAIVAGIARDAPGRDITADRALEAVTNEDVGDDLLRLVFIACHPILAPASRTALTLRLIGGLSTAEIARAYLVPEATIGQRIVRAKQKLASAKVPFELPDRTERAARLETVLEVVYLIFNEGYAATSGPRWIRTELCADALRLGRMLAVRSPGASEVHGLVALMELQSSRFGARLSDTGEPILLLDQDRSRWDRLAIARGIAALERASACAPILGAYGLQAELAAVHARALTAAATDWQRMVLVYDALLLARPTAVVALNRAVAVSMAYGPGEALADVDEIVASGALANYHLLASVRADLLQKLGRSDEALRELERAVTLARNDRERDVLLRRAEKLRNSLPS